MAPLYPWWHAALLSLAGPLCVLVTSQAVHAFHGGGAWGFIPSLAISLVILLVVVDQRRRRGAMPQGQPPVELRPVYRWYFIGAAATLVAIAVLAVSVSPWVSLPVSYLACLGGIFWFRATYARVAARSRARLA